MRIWLLVALLSLLPAPPVAEWLVLGSFSFDPDAGDPVEVAVSPDVLAAAPEDQERTEGIRWT